MTEELLQAWRAEEGEQPEGWDFAALEGRMVEPPVPWDLDALYVRALRTARAVLDMGTGGGEFLLRFAEQLPPDTTATEGWPPNVAVAAGALSPLGIDVVSFGQPDNDPSPAPMPFPDARFDLILNRHESFHPAEIARALRPGGIFLTQQVGGEELSEVHEALGHAPGTPHVRCDAFRAGLLEAGLEVVAEQESVDHYAFTEIAALVAYLRLAPWDAPDDFGVDRYADALLELHHRGPVDGEPLLATRIRFLLAARKPA